jgi:hypothetical protein
LFHIQHSAVTHPCGLAAKSDTRGAAQWCKGLGACRRILQQKATRKVREVISCKFKILPTLCQGGDACKHRCVYAGKKTKDI